MKTMLALVRLAAEELLIISIKALKLVTNIDTSKWASKRLRQLDKKWNKYLWRQK